MSTRRPLCLVLGALLAVGVLLAPQTVFAQAGSPGSVTAEADEDKPNTIKVSWTHSSTATTSHYDVVIKEGILSTLGTDVAADDRIAIPTATAAGGDLDHTFTDLKYDQWYTVGVRGVDPDATTPDDRAPTAWAAATAETGAMPASAAVVSSVTATQVPTNHSKLTVTWVYAHDTALTPDQGFYIYYTVGEGKTTDPRLLSTAAQIVSAEKMDAGQPGPSKQTPVASPKGTQFVAELTGLKGSTNYVVNVLAYSGTLKNVSTTEIPMAATAKTAEAEGPSRVRDVAVHAGNKELLVTWMVPVNTVATGSQKDVTITGYRVQWRSSQTSADFRSGWSTYPPDAKTKLTATEYKITGLYNDVTYEVQVQAMNSNGGVSAWAPVQPAQGTPKSGAAGTAAPGQPSISVAAGDAMLTVSWDAVEGATKYKVQWRTAAQSFGAADRTAEVTEGTSHDLTMLDNGVEYVVRVAAGNSYGYGSWSGEAKGTPMVPTPALPVFGALVLGAGLVAAGRRRLRAQRLLKA